MPCVADTPLSLGIAGYASFDYEPVGFEAADIVKVDLLLNGEALDALSFITHRVRAVAALRRQATPHLASPTLLCRTSVMWKEGRLHSD